MKAFSLMLIFGLLVLSSMHAQFLQSSFLTPETRTAVQKIGISVNSVSFFHNNEFFHPLEKGYTLTGTWVQPELKYAFNEVFAVSAGIHLLKYHGLEVFTRTLPIFSMVYSPTESLSLTLGNYHGGENHLLSEVLYDPERHLRLFPEGGMRIQLKNNRVHSDFWIDWERMIFHGDPFNEEVSAGSSTKFTLWQDNQNSSLTLPLQILAKHRGGQINTGDRSVITWWNALTGIESTKVFKDRFFKEVSFMLHLPVYYQGGNTGFGIYPQIGTEVLGNKISAGYFHASDFRTIHGIGLYDSYSLNPSGEGYIEGGTSQLLTFKAGFSKKIHEQVHLVSRLGVWYDLKRSKIDYMTGLYLIIKFESSRPFLK